MPRPSDYERLSHILVAVALAKEFTQGMDYADFLTDRKTQLSVERLLEIIGEAASHISPVLRAKYPLIPWRQMADLRNVVSHEYFQLRVEIVWDVVHENLPEIELQIANVLQEWTGEDG